MCNDVIHIRVTSALCTLQSQTVVCSGTYTYLICVAFIGMTPANLPGSAIPSPSTSPTSSPIVSANLWPVLFAPLAVVLLVLVIVAVAAIVYCKRRRRNLNLKHVPSKRSPEDDSGIERYNGWFIPFHSLQGDHKHSQFSHNSVVC